LWLRCAGRWPLAATPSKLKSSDFRPISSTHVLMPAPYDALLLVSFGGPEGPDEVLPFLENVLRGRNVPRERMLEVAEHYQEFGGVSPINEQNRRLKQAIERDFAAAGLGLPVYWGNRNWHPLLEETLEQMAADGVQRALAFVTSATSSYSGCRQYREDIARAQEKVGEGAPEVDKLRVYFNHPGFIEPMIDNTRQAFAELPAKLQHGAKLLFTAHSLPVAMARNCRYEAQLGEACRLVAEGVGRNDWQLVYQSRSGPPQQPWLEPDVCDQLEREAEAGTQAVVIVPIGFVSDHMEILFDLDTEARQLCDELGIAMVRGATVGTDPRFVQMVRELVLERLVPDSPRRALGNMGPSHDVCPVNCCLYDPRAAAPLSPHSR
jgi:ferrochelatase